MRARVARAVSAVALAAAVFGVAASAQSAPVTVSVGGSSITVDGETQDGLFNWEAGGVDQVSQQWIWFRSGTDFENPLNTLSLISTSVGADFISLTHEGGGLNIAVTYTLTGGSQPRIDETIAVQNIGTSQIGVSVFLYSDLDVNGSPDGDIAAGDVDGIAQTDGGTRVTVRPVGLLPDAFQIDFFSDLLDALNDGLPTNLNNSGNGLGPSDLTHAFQWDLVLDETQVVTLAAVKEFALVPLPSGWALGLVGLGAVAWRTRHRRA